AEANGTLASYYKDHKDEYMCLNCYNAIVVNGASAYVEHAAEWTRGLKRCRNVNLSMSESISLLINIIIEREVIGNDPPIVTFSQLKLIAEDKNDQLSFFFNEIEEMACLEKKNEAEQRALE
ncbi:32689_t:CDS:1, partial [Racocetra persica]